MKSFNRANKHGFTMIEIMCVLIIISIVSSIAMPAINNFHSAERCKAEASVLVSYIRQAKYQAMQDNCINRLIFSPEGGAFKIQKYDPETESNDTFDNIINKSESAPTIHSQSDRYELDDWKSIADEEEILFNSSVEVELSPFLNTIHAIYFKPDGYIYCYNSNIQILPEERILFKYGSSAVAVDINALGVISSEAIPVEENDFDNENEADGDDPTDGT